MKTIKTPKRQLIMQPDLSYKDFTPKQLIQIHRTAIFQWVHINLVLTNKINSRQVAGLHHLYNLIVNKDSIIAQDYILYNMPAEEFIARLINHFNK